MADEEFHDVFKDFKFEDSKEPSHDEVRKQAQKEFNKSSFIEPEEKDHGDEIRELKNQVRELKHHINKPKEEATFQKEKKHEVSHTIKHAESNPEPKHTKKPFDSKPDFSPKTSPSSLERKALVGVIIILLAFIAIDMTFYHGSKTTETTESTKPSTIGVGAAINEIKEEDKTVKAVVEVVNKTTETEKEENITTEEETKAEEEKELSGKIEIMINKIHSIKENDYKGYINKVTFTIKNGKNKTLKPVVKVYAYDKTNDDPWMERNRGEFIYTIGIVPGGEQTGSIDLYPKTFADMDIIKTVILKLYDEDDEVIASALDKFYIK